MQTITLFRDRNLIEKDSDGNHWNRKGFSVTGDTQYYHKHSKTGEHKISSCELCIWTKRHCSICDKPLNNVATVWQKQGTSKFVCGCHVTIIASKVS